MRKTFFNIVAAVTVLGSLTAPAPAWADGGCVPDNIAGQVPRLTRPSDNVCVPPNIANDVRQENAAAASGKGYVVGGGAYGPKTCVSGSVWREGYDGDAVCVSPQRRQETWQENANAGLGATGGLHPQAPAQGPGAPRGPAPQAGEVVLQVTGSGTALTVDIYDPKAEPRMLTVPLPFSRTITVTPHSGDLFQIVAVGKGNTAPGCRITVSGKVVAEQPVGGSGQCVFAAP